MGDETTKTTVETEETTTTTTEVEENPTGETGAAAPEGEVETAQADPAAESEPAAE